MQNQNSQKQRVADFQLLNRLIYTWYQEQDLDMQRAYMAFINAKRYRYRNLDPNQWFYRFFRPSEYFSNLARLNQYHRENLIAPVDYMDTELTRIIIVASNCITDIDDKFNTNQKISVIEAKFYDLFEEIIHGVLAPQFEQEINQLAIQSQINNN